MSSLTLEDVYVHFPIFGSQPTLRKAIYSRSIGGLIGKEARRKNRVIVKALEGISLDLKDGDRLGLVGHNGAGKSTLLRVMAGIYEPVSGRVSASGKITPLLEVLPALDGEDSGYDNIVSSGLMLGMSNSEIQNCIADIEEFTELGEYLALPVRTYSAGMLTRLGFALATAIEPDILLIDEGIGAGDQRFAAKAAQRLDSLVGRSRILVLSSHSDQLIHQFCNKVALLQEGRIIALGPASEMIEQYHSSAASALTQLASEPVELPDEQKQEISSEGTTPADISSETESVPADLPDVSHTEQLSESDSEPAIPENNLPDNPTLDDAIRNALAQLTSLYYAKASNHTLENKYDEALESLKKSLEFDPQNILAHLTVGQIETSVGSLMSAATAYRNALKIIPHHEAAITGLTNVLYKQATSLTEDGKYLDAWSMVEECLGYRPKNVSVITLGARIQAKLGSKEESATLYKRALEISPSDQEAITGYAHLTAGLNENSGVQN